MFYSRYFSLLFILSLAIPSAIGAMKKCDPRELIRRAEQLRGHPLPPVNLNCNFAEIEERARKLRSDVIPPAPKTCDFQEIQQRAQILRGEPVTQHISTEYEHINFSRVYCPQTQNKEKNCGQCCLLHINLITQALGADHFDTKLVELLTAPNYYTQLADVERIYGDGVMNNVQLQAILGDRGTILVHNNRDILFLGQMDWIGAEIPARAAKAQSVVKEVFTKLTGPKQSINIILGIPLPGGFHWVLFSIVTDAANVAKLYYIDSTNRPMNYQINEMATLLQQHVDQYNAKK